MKRKHRPVLVVSLPFALAAGSAGCDPFPDDSTMGDRGRIEFAYASQCLFDCALSHPMAVGSTELISFDGAQDYALTSSNDEIATFSKQQISCGCSRSDGNDSDGYGPVDLGEACQDGYQKTCNTYVEAVGRSDGDAKLQVRDGDGELVDQVTVQVRRAQGATFKRISGEDWKDADAIEGAPGAKLAIRAVFHDSKGRALMTSKGVAWSSDAPETAGVQAEAPLLNWSRGNWARLDFGKEGQTVVRATLGDLEASLPIFVTE